MADETEQIAELRAAFPLWTAMGRRDLCSLGMPIRSLATLVSHLGAASICLAARRRRRRARPWQLDLRFRTEIRQIMRTRCRDLPL
jgi:hypothetical protein